MLKVDFSKHKNKGTFTEKIIINNNLDANEIVEIKKKIDTITLKLDDVLEKQLKVIAVFADEPDAEYKMINYELDPKVLNVRGSKTLLSKLEYLRTELISLKNRKESFVMSAKIQNDLGDVKMPLDFVELKVELEKKTESKEFDDVKVSIKSKQFDFSRETNKIKGQLYVKGSKSIIDQLNNKNFEIVANFPNVSPENLNEDKQIEVKFYPVLPFDNLKIWDYYPKKRVFTIDKIPTQNKEIE